MNCLYAVWLQRGFISERPVRKTGKQLRDKVRADFAGVTDAATIRPVFAGCEAARLGVRQRPGMTQRVRNSAACCVLSVGRQGRKRVEQHAPCRRASTWKGQPFKGVKKRWDVPVVFAINALRYSKSATSPQTAARCRADLQTQPKAAARQSNSTEIQSRSLQWLHTTRTFSRSETRFSGNRTGFGVPDFGSGKYAFAGIVPNPIRLGTCPKSSPGKARCSDRPDVDRLCPKRTFAAIAAS